MANELKTERDLLQELISKSEDEFEKKLTYISAGALLLSVTLLEKVITLDNSHNLWILITGWVFLILTLLINLISHLISKVYLRKGIDEIDNNIAILERNIKYRIRLVWMESLNWSTTIFLIIGIACVTIFVSLNASNPSKKDNDSKKQNTIIIKNN